MTRRVGDLGEFELIAREMARPAPAPAAGRVAMGAGDDAAVLDVAPGCQVVATTDALVEQVHFRREWSTPNDIGWKALAVSLSDLDAMGARPLGALVAVGLPRELPVRWIDGFYAGLHAAAARYCCPIVGGDTVRCDGGLFASVTALGSVPTGRYVQRGGAVAGDLLCVTGVLGGSAAGLAWLQSGRRPGGAARRLIQRHCRPQPPGGAGAALAAAGLATAMLDLSDGLAGDLRHLCTRSGVGALVNGTSLPISDDTRQAAQVLQGDACEWALQGGEDYELLFTVPPDRFAAVPPLLASLGVTATIIGSIGGKGVRLQGSDGNKARMPARGFVHFAG